MLKIVETFQYIQRDRPVLHVLADQVADVLARRRVHVPIARSFIDVLAKRVSQLHIETAAQSMALREKRLVRPMLPPMAIDINTCQGGNLTRRGKPTNYVIPERPKTELPALLPTADFAGNGPLNPGHSTKFPAYF
jgi:hypothetical protein